MVLAYDRRVAIEEEDVGELDVADYLVFLFALDTYMRWVEETEDVPIEMISMGANEINLSLAAFPAGEYLVEITARGAEGDAKELIPLRVVS